MSCHPKHPVVGTAGEGSEAVALVAETAPDVVLMDLSMPVMDGVDATRAILASGAAAKVVVLTSFPTGSGSTKPSKRGPSATC